MAISISTCVLILIPFRNESQFLHKTLESVSNQTFDNWLVVGQDNNSTDSSVEIFRKYQQSDDRFLLFKLNQQVSVEQNWNSLYQRVKKTIESEYVCWLGGDDYWKESDYLKNCLDKFDNFTSAVVPTFRAQDFVSKELSEPYRINLECDSRKEKIGNLTQNWANALSIYGLYKSDQFNSLVTGRQSRISSYEGSDWWWTFNLVLHCNIRISEKSTYIKTFKNKNNITSKKRRMHDHFKTGLRSFSPLNLFYSAYSFLIFNMQSISSRKGKYGR